MIVTKRASRITWGFLLGIFLLEGWAVLVSFRAHGNFAAALWRYASTPPGTSVAWGMAVLVTTAYAAYAASASPIIRDHMLRPARWRPFAAIRIVAVPMALISGFFEEAFFRKALMDYVMHRGAGIVVQLAITATVFGAAHAVWGLVGGSVRGALGAMAATGILGGALGAIYIVGGRSIGPCMAAHIAINLLIEPWLILAAATHDWRQQKSDA